MKLFFSLIIVFYFTFFSLPAFSTDSDYSQAAGHTGVYVNVNKVSALKCKILTYDLTAVNNKLGWYTAWPMIVDYKSGKFVQIGYITSPIEDINKPVFYVAWSNGGNEQINIKYLPDRKSSGNALFPQAEHEYVLSLNKDGSVNIQIDGIKYLEKPAERINIGISEGVGEFFSEGSNLNMQITTKFSNCFYKFRSDLNWRKLDSDKNILLYHVANGTSIKHSDGNSFMIKGKIREINKGKFLKNLIPASFKK